MNTPTPPQRIPRYFWPLYAVLGGLCLVPIWICAYFPTQNGPSLLLISFMQAELNNPAYGFAEYFDWHPFPVPYLLQTAAMYLLFPFFDPITADKIWITGVVLLRVVSVAFVLRSAGSCRVVFAIAALPFIYDFSLMRGYYNFHAGVSIGFIVLGLYMRLRESWTLRAILAFNVLVLLQYFGHPVALVATGILIAGYEFALSRSIARIATVVGRCYMPSIALLIAFLYWSRTYGAWVHMRIVWSSPIDKIENILYRGATPLSGTAAILSLTLLGSLLLAGAVRTWRQWQLPRSIGALLRENPTLGCFAAAILLYLAMPWELAGWHKADVRIIPLVLMTSLVAVPAMRTIAGVHLWCLVSSATFVVSLPPMLATLQRDSAELVEYVGGIDAVPARSRILSITVEPPKPEQWTLDQSVDHLKRADNYYCLAKGGATANSLAQNNTLYWVWFRDYRKFPDHPMFPRFDVPDPTDEQLQNAAAAYDAIVFWTETRTDLIDRFKALGFTDAFRQGRLTILISNERVAHK